MAKKQLVAKDALPAPDIALPFRKWRPIDHGMKIGFEVT
jgi:hypothetical protein